MTSDRLVADGRKGEADGAAVLSRALTAGAPVVGILGQAAGLDASATDSVLELGLNRVSREGSSWRDLISRAELPLDIYEWLAERFQNRTHSPSLLAIADIPLSAVYTSSVDPRLVNLFATEGREPQPVLFGDPPPPASRSTRRPPVYYLFGRAGGGPSTMVPPRTTSDLSQRRVHHAIAMLKTIGDTTSPLGLIVVDGFIPSKDWLRGEDLLAVLSSRPIGGVLWCGSEPVFLEEDAETYADLVARGIVVQDPRSLGQLAAIVSAEVGKQPFGWDEPGVVSLADGRSLVTTARLRLATQAAAAIIDDSWLGFLPPLELSAQQTAFAAFHAVALGARGLLDGIRRNFAITRQVEATLFERVARAVARHYDEKGAIVLHGQSGVGKTIALGRLALRLREKKVAAVLLAHARLIQAEDVSEFLAEVDKIGGVTVVIVDSTSPFQRYDDLLQAFRSRGHRVVVIGTTYRVESQDQVIQDRFIAAPATLTGSEEEALAQLAQTFQVGEPERLKHVISEPHALARFFWQLPSSRSRISEGLGKEARHVEGHLRRRGSARRPVRNIGTLGLALVEAGYGEPSATLFDSDETESDWAPDSAAGRVIDYVMAVARLYKWIPVNLLLRGVVGAGTAADRGEDIELVRELFSGQDLFRWRFADGEGQELLVGARLQIEAELICNRRLGGPDGEVARIVELVTWALRAGEEGNEETRFLIDVVYALGPDGPAADRYRNGYVDVARALTALRVQHGVKNARLMLQEATLRRHYVRTHTLDLEQKATILDEARAVIDEAIQESHSSSNGKLYVSRRTRDNLWVERAATYGFLATDSAQRKQSAQEVWLNYKAAREAVRSATARVETYFPLDIALWLPANILREATNLGEAERLEIQADVQSTLDVIDPDSLEPSQYARFQEQRYRVADVLGSSALADKSFAALAAIGSSAGYYLRARSMAPVRPDEGEQVGLEGRSAARAASSYLWKHYESIVSDARCLTLLLSCEWVAQTGRWLFRGQRQPIPASQEDRIKLRHVLIDLLGGAGEGGAKYRYLEAVLAWLTSDEAGARVSFRTLAAETEYVERGRVISRHIVTDAAGQPISFDGVIEKQISDGRWSVYVESLSRRVDLVRGEAIGDKIHVGEVLNGFGIAFNYLGPLVDFRHRASRA